MSQKTRILIVDDELIIRESLLGWLKKSGHDVRAADGGQLALKMMDEAYFDLVFLDVKMPDVGGLDILKTIKARYPDVMVVMITAFGSVENAVQAMKLGAKRLPDEALRPGAPERSRGEAPAAEAAHRGKYLVAGTGGGPGGVRRSDRGLEAHATTLRAAGKDREGGLGVLVRGETGTGKELIARAIHARSNRSGGPFVPINCGAFTETLLESELFGHEAGAFTGAARSGKKGRLEMAQDGTLFLDEIGEIPPRCRSTCCGSSRRNGFSGSEAQRTLW